MKKVSRRAFIALVLAAVLAAGSLVFAVEFFINGEKWAADPQNADAYVNGLPMRGLLLDRNGLVLVNCTGGAVYYNDDPWIRTATLHLTGDAAGNISSGALRTRTSRLLGYDLFNGLYAYGGQPSPVSLSVDGEVCAAAAAALGGYSGCVGVYDYTNGEMICLVSSPSFDPAYPPSSDEIESFDRYEGVYVNRFISGLYVPGSVFKVVTAQAAIETVSGIYGMTFECTGSTVVGGQEITCSGVHGSVDIYGAMANSCNCAFAQIAQLVGADMLAKYFDAAGLCDSLDFNGLTGAAGSIGPSDERAGTLAWAAIGQDDDLVNPCAFMAYMGAIANGGVRVTPTLQLGRAGDQKRIMSADTAAKLRALLKNNVTAVYGEESFPGLDIYAKSGTAQIDGRQPHSVFAGFIDDEAHPYAFFVIAENAGAGLAVAAPVATAALKAATGQ